MSLKKKSMISDKVQEIKRMQNNWMKQRAASTGERQSVVEVKHSNNLKGNLPTKAEPRRNSNKDTTSWVVSSGQKKKHTAPSSLRSRSASPARNSSGKEGNSTPQSRPSSGRVTARSNPASSRNHRDSRPPSGISQKLSKDKKAADSVKSSQKSCQLDLSLSETDLKQVLQNFETETRSPSDEITNGETSLKTGPSYARNGDISQSEQGPSDLMDPNNFNNFADQLSQKVKKEILEEQKRALMKLGVTQESILLDETHDKSPSTHHCNKCKQLMVPPDHTPVLLVTCGHTFCEPCAEDRIKCPTCRTKVSSTAVNESLQQIILKSTGKDAGSVLPITDSPASSRREFLDQSHKSSHPSRYNPADYSDSHTRNPESGGKTNSLREDESRNYQDVEFRSTFAPLGRQTDVSLQMERYQEEFDSLSIRCEAYEHEEEEILNRVKKKDQDISKQKSQISNIDREQQRIREEINHLQEKLTVLKSHQEEFQTQCAALEKVKENDLESLKTLRATKKGLEKQREKIRFLARNFGLSLE